MGQRVCALTCRAEDAASTEENCQTVEPALPVVGSKRAGGLSLISRADLHAMNIEGCEILDADFREEWVKGSRV